MIKLDKDNKDDTQQVPFRIHKHDYVILKRLLAHDDLKFQKFISVWVDGYLNADPNVLTMLKNSRVGEDVPPNVLERYTLSQRERQKILEDIEKEESSKPITGV